MAQSVLGCEVHDDCYTHILRRMGAAVARRWADLPEDAHELLLKEATLPENPYEPALEQEIEKFTPGNQHRNVPRSIRHGRTSPPHRPPGARLRQFSSV
jgi:hypothetical protein